MPPSDKTAKMLRADLDAAGIPYRDESGRVADFHSLRHAYITALAKGGVHPKLAQALARHSTITVTMDRYTHTLIGEQADALDALPDLSTGPEREAARATGIDGKSLPSGLPDFLPEQGTPGRIRPASVCTEADAVTACDAHVSRAKKDTSRTAVHRGAAKVSPRHAGLEPATFGSVDRCSVQLS
jgi:hypothetical protein